MTESCKNPAWLDYAEADDAFRALVDALAQHDELGAKVLGGLMTMPSDRGVRLLGAWVMLRTSCGSVAVHDAALAAVRRMVEHG